MLLTVVILCVLGIAAFAFLVVWELDRRDRADADKKEARDYCC